MNWSLISSISENHTAPTFSSNIKAVGEWNLSSTPNMSDETSAPQCRRQSPEAAFIRNFELSTKSAFVVLSVAANMFLLVMLFRYGNMRSRAILFMANLCAADLAVSLLSTLSFIVELLTQGFMGGMILCKLVRYLQLFGPYAASFAIVSMGVDRYLAIVHPLSNYSRSDRLAHAGWLLAAPWLLSALVASPQLFLFTLSLRQCILTADAENSKHSSTEPPHLLSITICGDIYGFLPLWVLYASITFHIVIIYFIPAIILVYSYSTLSRRVWSSYNLRSLLSNARHNHKASTSTTNSSIAKTSVASVVPNANHFGGGDSFRHRAFEKSLSLEPTALSPEPLSPLANKSSKAPKSSRSRFFRSIGIRFNRVRFSMPGAVSIESSNSNSNNGGLVRRNGFGSLFGFHIRRSESSPSIRNRALTMPTQAHQRAVPNPHQQFARASLDKAPSTARTSNASDQLCDDIQVLQLLNHRDKQSVECAASGSASQTAAVGGPADCERPVIRGASKRRTRQAAQMRAHIRTLLITFVIVMLFILSWAPYAVTHLLWLIFPHIAEKTLMVQLGVSLCSILGSCLDPLIYMAFHLRSLFKRRQVARAASASASRSSYRSRPASTAANALLNQSSSPPLYRNLNLNLNAASVAPHSHKARPLSVSLSAGGGVITPHTPTADISGLRDVPGADHMASHVESELVASASGPSNRTPMRSTYSVMDSQAAFPSTSWAPLQPPRNVLRCVSAENNLMHRANGSHCVESPMNGTPGIAISQQLLLHNSSESDTLRALKRCVSEEMDRELECGAAESLLSSGPATGSAVAVATGADGPLGAHFNFELGGHPISVTGLSRGPDCELISVRHAPSAERLCAFKSHNVTVVCGIAHPP